MGRFPLASTLPVLSENLGANGRCVLGVRRKISSSGCHLKSSVDRDCLALVRGSLQKLCVTVCAKVALAVRKAQQEEAAGNGHDKWKHKVQRRAEGH